MKFKINKIVVGEEDVKCHLEIPQKLYTLQYGEVIEKKLVSFTPIITEEGYMIQLKFKRYPHDYPTYIEAVNKNGSTVMTKEQIENNEITWKVSEHEAFTKQEANVKFTKVHKEWIEDCKKEIKRLEESIKDKEKWIADNN